MRLNFGTQCQDARKGSKIPQSLRHLLDSSWYAETEDLTNLDQFKQKGQFGFVNDVFVPPNLVDQLEHGQMIKVACIRKLDKKKNRWGLSAIAILDN